MYLDASHHVQCELTFTAKSSYSIAQRAIFNLLCCGLLSGNSIVDAEANELVLKSGHLETSHCGLAVTKLAWKAGNLDSIPVGGIFSFPLIYSILS